MFALLEIGQALMPGFSVAFAGAGGISEAIYFPLSAVVVVRITRHEGDAAERGHELDDGTESPSRGSVDSAVALSYSVYERCVLSGSAVQCFKLTTGIQSDPTSGLNGTSRPTILAFLHGWSPSYTVGKSPSQHSCVPVDRSIARRFFFIVF